MERPPRPPLALPLPRRALLTGLAGLGVLALAGRSRTRAQEPEALAAALLDGMPLLAGEAAARNALLPVAVMLDNLPAARPQTGLDRADLVYELLVEGGITRFMAVYHRQDAEWVEPVRSARTPFLYLAKELGAVLAHVGAASTAGPTDADTQFGQWGVRHLDEQWNPGPFWRDRTRVAPHNAVTSTVEVRGHALGLGWEGPAPAASWLYKDDFSVTNALAGTVAVISYAFASNGEAQNAFAVDWYYDPDTNTYWRSMAGRAHRDGATGLTLSARNVVVQYDSAEIVNGEGHVLYGSLGSGPAYIVLDGQLIDGTWTKPALEERTRYWDTAGIEIQFNRGNTWVAVVPYGSPLGWE